MKSTFEMLSENIMNQNYRFMTQKKKEALLNSIYSSKTILSEYETQLLASMVESASEYYNNKGIKKLIRNVKK